MRRSAGRKKGGESRVRRGRIEEKKKKKERGERRDGERFGGVHDSPLFMALSILSGLRWAKVALALFGHGVSPIGRLLLLRASPSR